MWQTNKALLLSLVGLGLAFIASIIGHLPDLSFVIVSIVTAYVTGEGVQKSSAFFAASKDPNCNTASVINTTLGNSTPQSVTTISDIISDVKTIFNDLEDYIEGSEKVSEDGDDNG